MSIAMNRKERQEFLAGVHVGILSIPRDGAGPLTCPIWYQYEPGGDVVFVTGADSRKARLIEPGTRVSFLVQQEDMPPKYVSFEGSVVSIEKASVDDHVRPIARRYLGDQIGDQYIDSTRGTNIPDEILVRIRPEHWLSADFAKRLAGG